MAINIFANDTFFSLSGGNLVPVNEESVSIEMREETITLDFQENFYEVTVDFVSAGTKKMFASFAKLPRPTKTE